MNWWAVDVQASPGRREALAAWLVAHTGQAVEEREDGTLVSVVPDVTAAEALLGSLTEQGTDVRASRRELSACRRSGEVSTATCTPSRILRALLQAASSVGAMMGRKDTL